MGVEGVKGILLWKGSNDSQLNSLEYIVQLHIHKQFLAHLFTVQLPQQPISNKLDVLDHEKAVHANEGDRQGLRQELDLNLNSVADNFVDALLAGFVHQVAEHQTGKVCVQPLKNGIKYFNFFHHTRLCAYLVSRDQLIAEGEPWHQTSLFQPENCSKTGLGKHEATNQK